MKNLTSYLSYAPRKLMGIMLIAAMALVVPMAISAQSRPTMPYNGPGTPGADKVVFNSFTGVPNIGDERDFLHGKISGASGGFTDPVNVSNGDEVLVRVYVHNNADSSLNESGEGVAKNTRVRVELPTGFEASQDLEGFVSADNATPSVVSDKMTLNSAEKFAVDYVEGSATIKTNAMDRAVSDNIVNGGVLIGDDQLDGNLKGCFEYVALVTFKVKVNTADLDVVKTVKVDGSDQEYAQRNTAKVGDTLNYKVEFTNTGDTTLNNVLIGDNLPAYVEYVPGTTYIRNANSNDNFKKLDSDNIADGGINIGNYTAGSYADVFFQAKITDALNDECGTATLRNVIVASSDETNSEQNAAITTVDLDECVEQESEPEYRCEALTASASKLKVNQKVTFTTDAEAKNGASIDQYRYDFGDGSDVLVTDRSKVSHRYSEKGTYRASVEVVFNVDGEKKTVSDEDCAVNLTVNDQPTPETPDQPEEIVNTGVGSALMTITGTGAIGQAAISYVKSRRGLKDVLKN